MGSLSVRRLIAFPLYFIGSLSLNVFLLIKSLNFSRRPCSIMVEAGPSTSTRFVKPMTRESQAMANIT